MSTSAAPQPGMTAESPTYAATFANAKAVTSAAATTARASAAAGRAPDRGHVAGGLEPGLAEREQAEVAPELLDELGQRLGLVPLRVGRLRQPGESATGAALTRPPPV